MSVSWFVLRLDLAGLRYYTGGLLQLLAVVLLVPFAVALLVRDLPQAGLFALVVGATWAGGWGLRRGGPRGLGAREALVLTAVGYLLFAAVGAVGFLPVASPVDAFFETMSGFTTTGLTVMPVRELPRSLLFFRAYSQWLGGAGIIVLSLVVLAGPRSVGTQLYTAEFEQSDLLGNIVETGRVVVVTYGALTLLGILGLWAAGAGLFDAVAHGLSLASTGGFSPFVGSFGAYEQPAVPAVAAVFMVLGATSLPLFYLTWQRGLGRLFGDRQLRLLLALIVVTSVLFALFEGTPLRGLDTAAFHVTSAVTTTGFVVGDVTQWSEASRMLILGLMVVGGSLGSTAGGIKLLRLLVLARTLAWAVFRNLVPSETQLPLTIGGAVVGAEEIRNTLALLGGYLGLWFLAATALTGAGIPMADAVFEVASSLSTVGLSSGVASSDLPAWAKLVLTFTMWAGRVEILAVLVLLHPLSWLRG